VNIVLDNRNGLVWDISPMTSEVSWKTTRTGNPSTADITLINDAARRNKAFTVNNGDIVRITKDNLNLFYGYVFTVDTGNDRQVKIKAYDQIRYLMGQGTYVFTNVTADEVIRKVANDNGLATGSLDKGEYVIPSMVEDNKKLLDIILKAIDYTLAYKTQYLTFYDDFGKLTLKAMNFTPKVVLGPKQDLTGYSIKKSIDDETYNRIKLYKDDKDTGRRQVYIVQDSANIAKWGQLQLFQKADDNWNEAQIKEGAAKLLTLHNREKTTFSIDSIGDLNVRAGDVAAIILEDFPEQKLFGVEECTHKFAGGEHTMSLTLKVV
jgi:hypothetical protein